MADHPETRVVLHNWWNAPRTWQAVQAVDAIAAHGSWMENFSWNRVAPAPRSQKPLADLERLRTLPPSGVREVIGDGNCGGAYEKPDVQMLEIWRVAVEATREIIRTI
jgi:creatinine amidohydrolase